MKFSSTLGLLSSLLLFQHANALTDQDIVNAEMDVLMADFVSNPADYFKDLLGVPNEAIIMNYYLSYKAKSAGQSLTYTLNLSQLDAIVTGLPEYTERLSASFAAAIAIADLEIATSVATTVTPSISKPTSVPVTQVSTSTVLHSFDSLVSSSPTTAPQVTSLSAQNRVPDQALVTAEMNLVMSDMEQNFLSYMGDVLTITGKKAFLTYYPLFTAGSLSDYSMNLSQFSSLVTDLPDYTARLSTKLAVLVSSMEAAANAASVVTSSSIHFSPSTSIISTSYSGSGVVFTASSTGSSSSSIIQFSQTTASSYVGKSSSTIASSSTIVSSLTYLSSSNVDSSPTEISSLINTANNSHSGLTNATSTAFISDMATLTDSVLDSSLTVASSVINTASNSHPRLTNACLLYTSRCV